MFAGVRGSPSSQSEASAPPTSAIRCRRRSVMRSRMSGRAHSAKLLQLFQLAPRRRPRRGPRRARSDPLCSVGGEAADVEGGAGVERGHVGQRSRSRRRRRGARRRRSPPGSRPPAPPGGRGGRPKRSGSTSSIRTSPSAHLGDAGAAGGGDLVQPVAVDHQGVLGPEVAQHVADRLDQALGVDPHHLPARAGRVGQRARGR